MKVRIPVTFLLVASLSACSDSAADPAANDTGVAPTDTGTGEPDVTSDTTVPEDTDTPVPDAVTPDVGSDDTAIPDTATSDVEPGDTSTPDSGPTDVTETDVVTANCVVDTNFTGQVSIDDTAEPNGGAPRLSPYDASYDAGVGAVVAAALAANAAPFNTTEALTISNATVVATSFYNGSSDPPTTANRNNFWIADGTGAIEVELDFADPALDQPTFPIRVGSRISLTTTLVENNFNAPRIRAATGWTLGDVDQEVYIYDATAELTAADVNRLVRVAGRIAGAGDTCGGRARCWTLDTEFGDYELRSSSTFLEPGDCVTYVGPVGIFSNAVQFNAVNFDWIFEAR
jgi:hypothetical protein